MEEALMYPCEGYPLTPLLTPDEQRLLLRIIEESKTIIITCHQNADGDAIGSSLGLMWALRALGKQAQVIVPDQFPDFLMWLPGLQWIIRYDKHREGCDFVFQHQCDLLFCLDYNTLSRTADMQQSLERCASRRVLIDHHLNPEIAACIAVSRPDASSTSELVFRLVWQLGLFSSVGREFATCIYCGMMTDTGSFTYNSSSPDLYFILSQLLTKGIDKDRIYRNVYHNYSEQRLRLMGYVLLQRMVVLPQHRAAYYTLSRGEQKRFRFVKGDAEGLVNMPLQIKGLKLSVSLREDTEKENMIWVSLRSVDSFPCNKMAERYFNGGGHLNASGGRLQCSLASAEEYTRKAIVEFSGQFFCRN